MFEIQNYGSFIAAIVIFQMIPGAGTLAILNATARNGVAAGFGAVLGTLLGDIIYMVAAVAGLAALMQANPLLFQGLQWFGAAYLCWLGVQLLRAPAASNGSAVEPKKSARVYFRNGLAVALTNPKVILFFVAFFPLFIRPDGSSLTLLVMMLHITLISLVYQVVLVLLGNAAAIRLKALPLARAIATRVAGLALIGFGIKLAANNR
ncbi:threonine transporter [Pseudomonas chlororaphis]|jgi:threonine/homoserine/homoserine lactone efflux protein|uniref:LysE family translocator n=1 Tax=Pseudomonas morbosilactucae TaxID=2938197 RepID=A0ABT0JRK5_9PSED|nr:LysE family translocator [Pseudomonas morbosilactucae]MCK9818452.1 LysE family translocator [Pseudomonas morbosilactucae]ROL68948.1 threonine transporter [Pseudomonas chlororaphis]WEK11765.1 MAG: LysE family translocator [Pseudomonas sp.]